MIRIRQTKKSLKINHSQFPHPLKAANFNDGVDYPLVLRTVRILKLSDQISLKAIISDREFPFP